MGFLFAKPIQRAVAQNALKQHGQLGGGLVAVVVGQFHHAVLHDVKCRFLIANVVIRALERALFNVFEELGKFLFCGQERVVNKKSRLGFVQCKAEVNGGLLHHEAFF